MKLKSSTVLKLIVSIGLLLLIFTHINLNQIWSHLQHLSGAFVVFALLYYTGCQWLSCLRWQIILRATGYLIPISTLLGIYFAGMFVSIFLPGSFGGDVYRVYRIAKKTEDSETAFASVLLERFSGLAAVFGLALLGLPAAFRIIGSWDIILLFLVCAGVIWGGFILISSPKLLMWAEPWLHKLHLNNLTTRIAKMQIALRKFLQHRKALASAISVSLVVQLSVIYYQYLLAQNLKIPISYLELLVFTPISIVVTLLPISIGGLGVQEGLWIYLFSRVGLTGEQAVLLSLTFTILGWILSLPGAIIILLNLDSLKLIKRNKIE